ncbi:MAG: hypothetical protein QMD85_05250, partial [Candidatus Aenigmarchaeota archaeon]|nr:hypothetical protein [Candidatus Aenigmarchaeota archaeon]MDI6722971.1 hypothetical protein [Candidatus Aenigmarchaeota archaeon]
FEAFSGRLSKPEFSLVIADGYDIAGYIIAYHTGELPEVYDEILEMERPPDGYVYTDQLYLASGLHPSLIGVLVDTWDSHAREVGAKGVIAAIPWRPWSNKSSMRIVTDRGLRKYKTLKKEEIEFVLMKKPFVEVGERFTL